MKFEEQYFSKHKFTAGQIKQYLDSASKDLGIAGRVDIPEVRFTYAYSAFLKSGFALLADAGAKVKSVQGHHVKVIEMMAEMLKNDAIEDIGNAMRMKRNFDLYSGGVEMTEKDSKSYLKFAETVLSSVKKKLGAVDH